MVETILSGDQQKLRIFHKQRIVNGRSVRAECIEINSQIYVFSRGLLTTVRLENEWYEDLNDPESIIAAFGDSEIKPDLFTFWQRVPETQPRYSYHTERESLAVLPIKSFDYWWNQQVKGTTRNMIRKSQKAGVEVIEATFNDDFVRGMVDIFNEGPVRQGFRFWHYGKDFETVKHEFSRFLFREDVIAAYYKNELIGFAMVANAGRYGMIGMFIAKMKHRDKAVNNALMAKAVEISANRRLPYLIYTTWRQSSLVDFKRYSGFREMNVPRYFVPLTAKGKLALKLGLHRGFKEIVPDTVKAPIKRIRKHWYDLWLESGNTRR